MAKWSDKVAYDMETKRMKKAIQDIIDDSKNRITQDRQDELHGDPAHNPFLDDDPCPPQIGIDWGKVGRSVTVADTCPDCGEGTCEHAAPDDAWLDADNWHSVNVKEGYYALFSVLNDALNEAQSGKGAERHGNDQAFTDQPALTITRAVGLGFPLGQAMKKIQECQRMDTDAAKRELLGAINYLAAAILFLDE